MIFTEILFCGTDLRGSDSENVYKILGVGSTPPNPILSARILQFPNRSINHVHSKRWCVESIWQDIYSISWFRVQQFLFTKHVFSICFQLGNPILMLVSFYVELHSVFHPGMRIIIHRSSVQLALHFLWRSVIIVSLYWLVDSKNFQYEKGFIVNKQIR